jgi:DNA-directed RNA polymerase subunit K/omega
MATYKSSTNTTITRDLVNFEEKTTNVYETLAVLAKRANHISAELKEELNEKLSEFASISDNLEEIFENREQIEISKYYERLPKASLIAIQEYLDGKIYHRNPARENQENL